MNHTEKASQDEMPYWDWLNDHMDEIKPIVHTMYTQGTAFVFANQAATAASVAEALAIAFSSDSMKRGLHNLKNSLDTIMAPLTTVPHLTIINKVLNKPLGTPHFADMLDKMTFDGYKEKTSVHIFLQTIQNIFKMSVTESSSIWPSIPHEHKTILDWPIHITDKLLIQNFSSAVKRECVRHVLNIFNVLHRTPPLINTDDIKNAYNDARVNLEIARNNLIVAMLICSREAEIIASMQENTRWDYIKLKYFTVQFLTGAGNHDKDGAFVLHIFTNTNHHSIKPNNYIDIIPDDNTTNLREFNDHLDTINKLFISLLPLKITTESYEISKSLLNCNIERDLFAKNSANPLLKSLDANKKSFGQLHHLENGVILKIHKRIDTILNVHEFNSCRNMDTYQYNFLRYWCPPILQFIIKLNKDKLEILNPQEFLKCINCNYTQIPYDIFMYGFFHTNSRFQIMYNNNTKKPLALQENDQLCSPLLLNIMFSKINHQLNHQFNIFVFNNMKMIKANYNKVLDTLFTSKPPISFIDSKMSSVFNKQIDEGFKYDDIVMFETKFNEVNANTKLLKPLTNTSVKQIKIKDQFINGMLTTPMTIEEMKAHISQTNHNPIEQLRRRQILITGLITQKQLNDHPWTRILVFLPPPLPK